ncbi:MAG: hypothetical protein JO276_09620 [Sphingomonadaceae bacterium]|nr:hypothetical protein [Sphingomonadaceae bacterium]
MFDAGEIFTRQFIPHGDGYVFFPSMRSGGKFVTAEEFERLVANHQRVAGPGAIGKITALLLVAIVLWVVASDALGAPRWAGNVFIGAAAAAIIARLGWAAFAPRRLVKGREDVVPPRSASQARRAARGLVDWPFVIVALIGSGGAFVASLVSSERSFSRWAWLIGGGAMFAAYVWIGVQKLRDRR